MRSTALFLCIFLGSTLAHRDYVQSDRLLRARELRLLPRTHGSSSKISATGPAVIHSGDPRIGTAGKIFVMPGQQREASFSDPVVSAASGHVHPYLKEMYPNSEPSIKAKAQGRSASAYIQTGPNSTGHFKIKKDGVVSHHSLGSNAETRMVKESEHQNGVKMTAKLNGSGTVFTGSASNPAIIVPQSRWQERARAARNANRGP